MIMNNKSRRHLGLYIGILVPCVFLIVLLHTRALMAQSTDSSTNEAVSAATKSPERPKPELLGLPGVTAVGVGMMRDGATVGIHIYIQQGADARPMPRSMDGVPIMVIDGGSPFARPMILANLRQRTRRALTIWEFSTCRFPWASP